MFTFRIALNYLKGRKRFFFRSANLLALTGIVIGVFSLLVVSSVMNGFDTDMRNRVIGSKSEIKVHKADFSPVDEYRQLADRIENFKGIQAVSAVCENELMLQNEKLLASTVCYGVDYEGHGRISSLFDKIIVGEPDSAELEENGIIIGLDLSLTLNVTVGEYLQVSSPAASEPTPFGMLPRTKKLKVIGLFISGLPEFDRLYSYISIKNGQFFAGLDKAVTQLEIKTYKAETSREISRKLATYLGEDYRVEDWSQFEAHLFDAIRMEKVIIFFVLILMVILASFNMIGNFIKLVYEKKTEIGILKALGASDKQIVSIFMITGTGIGLSGVLTGTILALILLIAQKTWEFITIPVAGFPLQTVPVEIRTIDFILVPVITLMISFFTTLKPAGKALKIEPLKIIRNQ